MVSYNEQNKIMRLVSRKPKHIEQRKNEEFVSNVSVADLKTHYKSSNYRVGKNSYDDNGKIISDYSPVFKIIIPYDIKDGAKPSAYMVRKMREKENGTK